MKTVKEKVRGIVAEALSVDINMVEDDSSVIQLGADSLHCVEIIMALEEEFDIEIPDDDFETLMTVDITTEYINARKHTE